MVFAETRLTFRAVLAALTLLVPAHVAPGADKPRVIRVVMDDDYAPFVFRSNEGALQGILIDQWREWERQTGVKAEIHGMRWSEALRRMRAGEFDVIDTIVETEERKKELDFTKGYAEVGAAIFFRKEVGGITDVASLEEFPVGVKAGDQHVERLLAADVKTVIYFQSYIDIIAAAQRRQINVFVADMPAATYLLHKEGLDDEFRHSEPIFEDKLQRAVREGDAATLKLVSEGFDAIGPAKLSRINEKWFGRTIDAYGRYLEYAGYVVTAALLLALILFVWNRALNRRISQRTAALIESELRFRQIADNIREVFFLATVAPFKFLYVSPACETVWGRSSQSLYDDAQSFIDTIHPDDQQRALASMQDDRAMDVEYRVVRPDGSIRWIRSRAFSLWDDASRVYRVAGIAEDVTDRKSGEDHVRLIINTIPTMVWRLRPDGVIDFISQTWLEYCGITKEDVARNPLGPIHPHDVARVAKRWEADMAAGLASEDEMRLRRTDGEYRWFLVRTVPLRDESGTIVNWYGTSTDIEDRKRAEELLKQRERQLADAQRIAQLGSWDWDVAKSAGTWSDECYRLFGAQPGESDFYAKAMAAIHREDHHEVQDTLARAIETAEPQEAEFRVCHNGGERILRLLVHVVHNHDGTTRKLLGTVQDVTALRHAERELKRSSDQLRALSARMQSAREEEGIRIAREIHDELGASLTSLHWDLQSLQKKVVAGKTPRPAELNEKLAAMLGMTDTTINIVRRIASDLRPVVLDVLGLAPAIAWQARQFEERSGIPVHCEPGSHDLKLTCEQSTAVFRIFQEALTNVMRHAQSTRVDVTVAEDAGMLRLTVADNGRGIRNSEQFGEGAIGLLGMRERAHLIGGEVDITGIEGEGTTVILRVPLHNRVRAHG